MPRSDTNPLAGRAWLRHAWRALSPREDAPPTRAQLSAALSTPVTSLASAAPSPSPIPPLTSGGGGTTFYQVVESSLALDLLFGALSDGTRRAILARVARKEMSIGEIATHFELTFGAISKHVKVLERARLVSKRRRGKEQVVLLVPKTVNVARRHVERYARMWADRFDELESVLREETTS